MSSSKKLLAVGSSLFFVSGATGLAYEALWFKRFGQVWGSSALALASVVACFLFGLGLGAYLGGRYADRTGHPLRAYGICEGAIGVLALLVPAELRWLSALAAEVYPTIEGNVLAGMGLRILATILILVPPAFFMGATLPLLVRLFSLAGRPLGGAAAWLYAANSLGAACGVWLTGFHLLPALGIVWTNGAVAATSFLLCAAALLAAREEGSAGPADPASPPVPRAPWSAPVAGAAFASGLGALILQMVWARQLVVLLGGSTYAYSALLAIFIAGLGAGSLLFRLVAPADIRRLAGWISAAVVLLVAFTLLGGFVTPSLARWVGDLRSARASSLMNAVICATTAAALQGLPTLAMGFLFPAIVQIAGEVGRRSAGAAARTVGGVYAWNTAGSILGAFATAPFLLPYLGSHHATALALGAYVALPLLLSAATGVRVRIPVLAGCIPALAAVLAFDTLWRPDPRLSNLGLYLYGPGSYPDPLRTTSLLFFEEGPTSNVIVLEEHPGPELSVRVNGKVDGGTGPDMKTQLGLAWLPRFLRPDAGQVLVIGFGTGTTAGASLLFPGTRVDCAEIEPAMLEASPFFHSINYAPEQSERFRFIAADGRAHVQGTARRYDLIVSEPSNPWIAGVANLFTREFFLAARARLRRDGILAQWIQTYSLSGEEFVLVVRTLRSVFRDCAIFRLASGDTVLVASAARVLPTPEGIRRSQSLVDASDEIGQGLQEYFGTTDVQGVLLGHLLLDGQGVLDLLRDNPGEELHTDFNLRLEFDAPRHTFRGEWGERPRYEDRIGFPVDIALYQRLISEWGYGPAALEALRQWMLEFERLGERDVVPVFAQYGNALSPDDPDFLEALLFYRPPWDEHDLLVRARRLATLSPEHARALIQRFSEIGDDVRASVVSAALLDVTSGADD